MQYCGVCAIALARAFGIKLCQNKYAKLPALVTPCKRNPEDLAILYSNRAASYLKDGNCGECVKDCNMSLELSQFNVKSLLRRAAAYEALERYRQAYVDYKTALQIDCNIAAAHDGTNRMTKALTETDGPSWREKLPPIPTVPLSVKEKLAQMSAGNATQPSPTPQQNAPSDKEIKKAQALKEEGNALVKKGEHKKAIEKYSQSLKHNPTEVTTYTNRALCYLSVKQYRDAIRDCDEALVIDSNNVKALYRRAQAHKELKVRARVFIIALQLLIPTQRNQTLTRALVTRSLFF
uniref:Translocase of outer mitochondrial membrane 34 n=1 Tax=Oreochromis niloticus TaxID=8128 RepID=A0A669F874_ORENI